MKIALLFLVLCLPVFADVPATTPGGEAKTIPFDQVGVEAQKQYSGDGIGITPTADGATLRARFQRLEGRATAEGLWLTSTVEEDSGKDASFRVRAMSLGRADAPVRLSPTGEVRATKDAAAWLRPGLIEEYSTSMDGVRQDFVVPVRPEGTGELSVSLELTGVRAEAATYGAKLIVEGSGRELAYNRLHVTDATGRELTARMEVLDAGRLEVRVDDRGAAYPVRIDPTFSDADWFSMGGAPGTTGQVKALAVDGSGNVYVGGGFLVVGNVAASRIAKWNGSVWSALGSGMNNNVLALAVSGTDVYAGGEFTTAGGMSANYIARWDGSAWSAVGSGMNSYVNALAVSGTDLYAGGSFTTAGGVSAIGIAKWNGSVWSALGSGMNNNVLALAVSGTDLYAGGQFTTAGGVSANYIAKWDGSVWIGLSSGMNSYVFALAVSGVDLYAGGYFSTAGGVSATGIAKWNGSAWSALGSGMNHAVYAVAMSGTDLYAGGQFTTAGGVSANYIAKWNGSAWSALGSGMNNYVYALAVSGTDLYAGGDFTTAGGVGGSRIAKWNGSDWNTFGSGMNNKVSALAVSGTDLYAGGYFTTAGEVSANYIAKWNGSAWSALGSGMNASVNALAVSGTDLYAGGQFTTAGGVSANYIAKWNGSTWSALSSGTNGTVLALAVSGTDLYAGGYFSTAGGVSANWIAKWNGSAWSALGSGMNHGVYALAMSGTDLYAGGYFTTAGGVSSNYIAKWDGSAWSALGSGMTNHVLALAVSGTDLYAGGEFTTAGGVSANYIAKWDGSVWSGLSSGMNSYVLALSVSGADLYAGGYFTTAGGVSAIGIAKWNGSVWSALGSGMNNNVLALAVAGTDLYAGGDFVTAGGKVSAYAARFTFGESEIALSGNGVTIVNGDPTPDTADHTDFGGVFVVGGSMARTFTIANSGPGTLDLLGTAPNYVTLSGPGASAFTVSTQPASATVAAGGGTQTFVITFDPSSPGLSTATVSIANDDADENPFTFSIQGTGTVPEIVVEQPLGNDLTDPSSTVDFGPATLGSTVDLVFTIRNSGSGDLTGLGITIDGTHSGEFSVTEDPAAPVIPGGDTTFTVEFHPGFLGIREAVLHIASNDTDENPFDITLHGTGTSPEIAVAGNSTDIADGDNSPDAGDHTAYGSTEVAGGTVTRTYLISNSGTANLTVGNVEVGGSHAADFTVGLQPGATVAPGGTTTFQVTFDPSVPGTRTATLSFANSDLDENPFNFSIEGTGTAPEIAVGGNGTNIGDGDLTPDVADHTDFGGIEVATGTVTRTFTISNPGTSNLTLGNIAIEGSGAGDFTLISQPGAPVVAGESISFQVAFDPSTPGIRSATVSFDNNDGDEDPFNFSIQGTGTVPEIAMSGNGTNIADDDITPDLGDHTDFGDANIAGGTVTRTFTISNAGTSILTLGTVTIGGSQAAEFAVSTQPAGTVDPGETTIFQVTFDPGETGIRSATLSISSNDGDENPFNFSILGNGTVTEIAVSGNGNDIADGDSTPATADHTDFGFVDLAGGIVTRTFTILNPGTADLTVGTFTFEGSGAADFSITNPPVSPVPGGGSTTFEVTFDPSAVGIRTATLSFVTNDTDETPFNFSIRGTETSTDTNGNGFTDAEELAVAALQTHYRVGDAVDLDLTFLHTTVLQHLWVTGLPPGLTFSATTKHITGTITGELGGSGGEIRKYAGRTLVASLLFNLSVAPYQFLGGFEVLIENGTLPVGKAKLLVTKPGTFSATLELQGQSARSTKGTFTNPPVLGVQTVSVTFPAGRGGIPSATTVVFAVPSSSDLVTGTHGANTLRGFRLAKAGRSPAQKVTVAFENDTNGDRITSPGGTGYVTGTLSSSGLLSLRGMFGDGQSASLALYLSQINQAVVFKQPYTDKLTSFFGGIIDLGELYAPGRGGSSESQIAGLHWRKAPIATATSYKDGFGIITPLAVTGHVSKWIPMATAEGLALSLGLDLREIVLSYVAPPADVLPTLLGLRNTFSMVRLAPVDSVPFSGKAVPSTGTFSASMPLSGVAAKTTVYGVFLQDPTFGTQVGAGLVKIPITGIGLPRGSFQTAGIRLENE